MILKKFQLYIFSLIFLISSTLLKICCFSKLKKSTALVSQQSNSLSSFSFLKKDPQNIADHVITHFHFSSVQNNQKQWELQAQQGQHFVSEGITYLKKFQVYLYHSKGQVTK